MLNKKSFGDSGEYVAASYLKRNGYKILDKNFRIKLGEIDIIAKQKNTLIFCEVKTRNNSIYGHPFESVNKRKQAKIKRIAEAYIQRFKLYKSDVRFDVISIKKQDDLFEINHIAGAY